MAAVLLEKIHRVDARFVGDKVLELSSDGGNQLVHREHYIRVSAKHISEREVQIKHC